MRKIIALLIAAVLVLGTFPALAEDDISVMLNDTALTFDVPPMIIDGRTMVPLRAIFEALGAGVEYDNGLITAERGDLTVILMVGKPTMIVGNETVTLDVAPVVINGRTLVPARAVAEAFNCAVEWEPEIRTVFIMTGDDGDEISSPVIDFSTDLSGEKRSALASARYMFEQTALPEMLEHDDGTLKNLMLTDPSAFVAQIDDRAWTNAMNIAAMDYMMKNNLTFASDEEYYSLVESIADSLSLHAYQNYTYEAYILGEDKYCVLLNLADINVPTIGIYAAIVCGFNEDFEYYLLEQSIDGYYMLCMPGLETHVTIGSVDPDKAMFLDAVAEIINE